MRRSLLLILVLCVGCDPAESSRVSPERTDEAAATPDSKATKSSTHKTLSVKGLEIGGPWKPAGTWDCPRPTSAGTVCTLPYDKHEGRDVGITAMTQDEKTLWAVMIYDRAQAPDLDGAWKFWFRKLSEKHGAPDVEAKFPSGAMARIARWDMGGSTVSVGQTSAEVTEHVTVTYTQAPR